MSLHVHLEHVRVTISSLVYSTIPMIAYFILINAAQVMNFAFNIVQTSLRNRNRASKLSIYSMYFLSIYD